MGDARIASAGPRPPDLVACSGSLERFGMGGDCARARRRPRPLGFPGVARRVAFALAAVQFATCAALAAETARGLGGGEGADGGTAAATAADPPSTLTQDAPAPAAPTVEDATPRVGALDASGAPDLGSSAPLLDASLATVCAAKGAWEAFDNEVLRQTNASHVEARVCVTDAEQGASAAAAAAAEALAAAKREALAKKKEKEKEKKIPSLRDFKSDLEAKVADARDAKKGKKEAEQKEKEPREPRGGDGKDAKEVREAEAEARRESTSTRKNSDGFADDEENARRRGEELNDEERRAEPTREPSDAGYEPVPTPSVARRAEKTAFDAADQGRDARGESNDAAKKNGESNGAASANANDLTTASPRDGGGEDEALASPVPKPTPTADHAEGGSVAGTGERGSPDGAATGASDAGPTSSPPEASGEPSVEPTPVSLAALLEDADAAGAAREAEATPVAERLDVDSGKGFSTSSPSPDDPRERESRDDDGPPSPTTDAVPRSEGPGYSSTAEGADAAGRPRTSRVSGEASEQHDALGSTDASVSTDRGESDDDAPPRAPTESESESESESDPTESDHPDETRRSLVATPVPPEVRDAYASEVNYAAASNGAKVVSANPESKSTAGAALKENKDSYYLSPCATASREEGKWITVELSEEIAVTAVTVANYEFHSSAPRAFEVWGTSGPADKEDGYRLILEAIADQRREPQTFEVRPRGAPGGGAWSKHVKFKFTSHYGSFHFCTLSLLRVHGKDATQTLKEEMEAIDAEAREVEAILRENDESFLREKEKEEAEARAREEAEENARRESQAAARRVLETVRGEGKGGILSETAEKDESYGDDDDASDDETETENETENEEASSREDGEDGQDSARAGATNGGPLSVSGAASELASSPGSVVAEPDSSDATTRPSESRDERAGRKSDVVVSEKEKDARETSTEDEPSYPDETKNSTSSPTKAEEKRDASSGSSFSRLEDAEKEKEKKTPPSSSENVFSIMAKKIKSLELNQSMFDRYVEASNARVADRLDDVSLELEMAEESAANATAAAASAVATALAAAKDAARVEESARVSKLAAERRFNELESRLETLERERRRAEAIHRFGIGFFLLIVATTTTLFASVALLDAASSFSVSPKSDGAETQTNAAAGEGLTETNEKKIVGSVGSDVRGTNTNERSKLLNVPAGVGVGGLDRAWFVARGDETSDDAKNASVSVDTGKKGSVAVTTSVATSFDRALRKTRALFARAGASAEDARNARLVAGISALLIASLLAFFGCAILFVPTARVFSERAVWFFSFIRRAAGSARTVAARLARLGGLGAKALAARVARWRLGGGGE